MSRHSTVFWRKVSKVLFKGLVTLDIFTHNIAIIEPYNTLWCVFLREQPQVRFTEKQLNKRLDVSSRAQRGSVRSKRVFNCSLSNLTCERSQKKTSHKVLYGVLRSTIKERCAERGKRGAPRDAREVRRERRERCVERGERVRRERGTRTLFSLSQMHTQTDKRMPLTNACLFVLRKGERKKQTNKFCF